MTQAAQLAQYGSNNVGLSFKNRLINSDMTIDQRNNGAAVTATDTTQAVYTIDRWAYRVLSASKLSYQRSTVAPAGFTNSILITSLSSYTVGASEFFSVRQPIEGFNVADFGWGTANAVPVTLSFWVRSSLTGTFGGSVWNNAENRAYVFSYSISAANTWEQKSVTIAGDTSGTWATNNTTGLMLQLSVGAGSNLQNAPNSWISSVRIGPTGQTNLAGTNGATFYITGVQLEKGSVATSFDYLPFSTELALCQRYYYTTGNMANPTGTGGGFFGMPLAVALAFSQGNTSFRTTMRAVPTITLFDNNGVSGSVTQHGVADNIPATAGGISQNGFMQVQRTSGSFSNSNAPITGGYTASIEL